MEHTREVAKKGLYAAGFLYVANMFAKNAGYDVMKKLGVTAAEDDVRGTSLANFYNLNEVPDGKKLDGRVLLDIGGVSVSDLNSLYTETNSAGIQTIDPNAFVPSPFGDKFRGMVPSVLTKEGPLTSKEEEYRRVGKELYKIAKVVRESYDKYIKPKNGLTIEQALRKDPDLKNASLMSFAMLFNSVAQSGRERVSGGIFGNALDISSYKMRKRFDSVFKDKKIGFEAVHTPIAPGVFSAQVMDFPIVIREDGVNKEYVVFSRYDYDSAKGNPDAITQALCKIPFEGSADDQVLKLKNAIIGRFEKVVESLNKSAKESLNLGPVIYKDGKFTSRLKVEKGSMLGKEETIDVFLKVSKDGSTVEVYKDKDGELLLNLDSSGDATKLYGNLVMAGLCQQDNMKPFFFLYKAKKLEFKGKNADGSFNVVAGDSKVEIKFKLDKASGKYVFAEAGAEAKLFSIKNYGFLRELAENAVKENKEWKREVERFGNVLENVPEDYMMNLFKSAPTWWKEATSYKWFRGFSADQFTGSIPKNYTKAMVGAQAEFLVSGMVANLAGAGSINAASDVISKDKTVSETAAKLKRLTNKLSTIKEQRERDGKEITSDDFKKDILADVSKLAIKSNTYALWYEQFSTYIFMKYGKDGLIKGNTEKAAKIVSVFAAYTYKMDIASMDKLSVDSKDYKKRAAYANYVAEQMFSKLNEWSGAKPVAGEMFIDIPDRGPKWEIDEWSEFDKAYEKDPSKYTVSFEHVAEKEALKMQKDYVTFDDWLRNKSLLKPGKELILPRKDCTLKFKNATEYNRFLGLIGPYTYTDAQGHDVNILISDKYTELELSFRDAIRQELDNIIEEYPDDHLEGQFQKLRYEVYNIAVQDHTAPTSYPATIDFRFDALTRFHQDVADIEAELGKGIVTKSYQDKAIKKKVIDIIENRILDKDHWQLYFKDRAMWEKVKSFFQKHKPNLF